MSDVIKLTFRNQIECNGQMYQGVAIFDGVDVTLAEACVPGVKCIQFRNTSTNITVMYDQLVSVSIGTKYPATYLQLKPTVAPAA